MFSLKFFQAYETVTMAYKKVNDDGKKEKVRMCIEPFPLTDDLICRVRDCGWFTAPDINSAFWSIPIRASDRYKTGFVTQTGHYQWSNLPFGIKNSSSLLFFLFLLDLTFLVKNVSNSEITDDVAISRS